MKCQNKFDIDLKPHWFSHVLFLINIYYIASGDWKYRAWNTSCMDYFNKVFIFL